jgi:hypothetical protein
MTFKEWLQQGIDQGWVSEIDCVTHNFVSVTKEEDEEFTEGFDPCVAGIRIWQASGFDIEDDLHTQN